MAMDSKEAEKLIDDFQRQTILGTMEMFGLESEATFDRASIKSLKAKLLAALTAQGQEVDLHAKIMNMYDKIPNDLPLMDSAKCYLLGCRDTRHAAAELVAGHWRKVE